MQILYLYRLLILKVKVVQILQQKSKQELVGTEDVVAALAVHAAVVAVVVVKAVVVRVTAEAVLRGREGSAVAAKIGVLLVETRIYVTRGAEAIRGAEVGVEVE